MKRLFTIGILAVALLVAARTPAAGRLTDSVRSLRHQLHHPAASAQSISPIERFVMSLATIS